MVGNGCWGSVEQEGYQEDAVTSRPQVTAEGSLGVSQAKKVLRKQLAQPE